VGSNVEFAGFLAVRAVLLLAVISIGAYIFLALKSKIYRKIDRNQPSSMRIQVNGRDIDSSRLSPSLLDELHDKIEGRSRGRSF
jgi:hypothetical protein